MLGEMYTLIRELVLLVSYMGSNNSFPQPLSPSEEAGYIERMKQGDMAAKDILIERNLRLVAHIIKKYANQGDADDLISIGTIGLIKAISTFDTSKGTQLATYAARCIENEILMYMRTGKKLKNEISLQMPLGMDKEGNEISLLDILGSDTDMVVDDVTLQLNVAMLFRMMRKHLSQRERIVLELRYGLGCAPAKTQREIADMLGISRSYVSRIEKKAISKLMASMKSE
ncbi:MAG TPA: RNA polymerase sporulation sigma factor SigK [Clostridia bacterium]|nr:RNA polymerase sporulation sigma factor SigK [Clostridia bacterium]